MKRLRLAALPLLVAAPLFAVEVDAKLDRAVRDGLPVCNGASVAYEEIAFPLPPRFTGAAIRVTSESGSCDAHLVAIASPTGGFFLGTPWLIASDEGTTIEEKLKSFAWRAMQATVTVAVDRTRTSDGLFKATVTQLTEAGRMPMEGEVDPEGTIFFFGHFRPMSGGAGSWRSKAFEPFRAHSPTKGASTPDVTIVEFSDFQCPSCQRASGYVDAILAKHGDRVRYIRYDLPLSGHSWAFAASMAGRAIWRQKPELFWTFKKEVYANQSSMNAFMFGDWARAFAEDHELDMKRYDADVLSEAIGTEILKGAGVAFSNDIRATPSYLVNGVIVEAGTQGVALAEYVEKLLGVSK